MKKQINYSKRKKEKERFNQSEIGMKMGHYFHQTKIRSGKDDGNLLVAVALDPADLLLCQIVLFFLDQ